jgi:hypothetical protein
MKAAPRRGDVYWVSLDPARGTEIKKTRPAVIVSNDSCNRFGQSANTPRFRLEDPALFDTLGRPPTKERALAWCRKYLYT